MPGRHQGHWDSADDDTSLVHSSQSSQPGSQTSSLQPATPMEDQGSETTHRAILGAQWGWGSFRMKAHEQGVETVEGCGWVQNAEPTRAPACTVTT